MWFVTHKAILELADVWHCVGSRRVFFAESVWGKGSPKKRKRNIHLHWRHLHIWHLRIIHLHILHLHILELSISHLHTSRTFITSSICTSHNVSALLSFALLLSASLTFSLLLSLPLFYFSSNSLFFLKAGDGANPFARNEDVVSKSVS